jgi:hypothetical protein
MMTRFSWGLAGCLLAVALVASAGAQEGQKGGRGRGGGFGFFGGNSLISLATNDAVQKELGVTDADKAKITTISEESNTARREEMSSAGVDFRNFQNLSDDERRAAGEKVAAISRKLNEKSEAKLKETLTPDQFKRLQEIGVQAAGSAAINDPRVAKELAMTDDQTKKIAEIRADYGQKQQALGRDGSREARQQLREEETKKVAEVLTKEQQDKLTALKGKEFDVSQLRQGRGGQGGDRPAGGTRRPNRPKTE